MSMNNGLTKICLWISLSTFYFMSIKPCVIEYGIVPKNKRYVFITVTNDDRAQQGFQTTTV